MADSGWPELRRRGLVVAGAAAVVGTGLVVTGRWPDGEPDGPASPSGRLTLADGGRGLRALDVALDDAATSGRVTTARRATGAPWRSRTLEAEEFSMLGLTWRGGERTLRLQTRRNGTWEPWREVGTLHDGPDAGSGEGSGRTGVDLQWVGRADAVRVEFPRGRPRGLSLTLMVADEDSRARAAATQPASPPAQRIPDLLSRGKWGADPALRSGSVTYNRTIRQMHVHHTVNSNDYARADVPGLIRGMYRYHTQHLGWSDIGYNFLVDRFGRIWVGRAGGAGKAVRGAHTLGFNDTSFGVAVIGNLEVGRPGGRVITGLVQLGAWKLHKHGLDPTASVSVRSTGSDKYPAGRTPRLPVIDGHRDTNDTACPGRYLYERLPEVRTRAKSRIARFAD